MAATYNGSDKRLAYLFENGGGGGGGSANIWTGTKADYEAQASQIADGTQVNITDDEIQSLIVSSYDVYSTEEKEVGVWTDGKPLYQKTVYIASVTSGTSYAHGAENVENNIIKNIKAKRNVGWFSSGHIFQDGTGYISESFSIIPSPTTLYAYLYGNTISDCSVTIQYTKTTDVAGSGIFVPSGSAAVHYSTTEQIIGTWINGKPLYRKTIYVGNSVTLNAQYDVPHDLVNIDEIVNKSGTYYDDADARQYPLPNMRVTYSESVWIACFVPSNHTPILAIQTGGYRYGNISKISVTLDYTKTTD